mmetsp:Transcript_63436/g.182061  ORF Transcript_63436/g.182061 Transcript_63436/m.182061 type:complete len:255 (-) Transcript_63436:754-1518(-)
MPKCSKISFILRSCVCPAVGSNFRSSSSLVRPSIESLITAIRSRSICFFCSSAVAVRARSRSTLAKVCSRELSKDRARRALFASTSSSKTVRFAVFAKACSSMYCSLPASTFCWHSLNFDLSSLNSRRFSPPILWRFVVHRTNCLSRASLLASASSFAFVVSANFDAWSFSAFSRNCFSRSCSFCACAAETTPSFPENLILRSCNFKACSSLACTSRVSTSWLRCTASSMRCAFFSRSACSWAIACVAIFAMRF